MKVFFIFLCYNVNNSCMKKILDISKIVLVAFFYPLFFLKLDHEVGVYPDGHGNIVKHHHYFSIIDNLKMVFSNRETATIMTILAFVVFAISIVTGILDLFFRNKILKLISTIFFIISVVFGATLIILSSTVNRVY